MKKLYSQELLAHAHAPRHATVPTEPTATASLKNPLCGDEIEVGICIADGVFQEVGYTVEACAICVASASVMAQELRGQPVEAFERKFGVLSQVTAGEHLPASDLRVFATLADFPSRRPCALLPWQALERALHVKVPTSVRAPTEPAPATEAASLPGRCPWQTVQTLRAAGHGVAVATLVWVEGSSPCPLGSRMVVSTSGEFWGSVSGGCVEAAVVRSALELLASNDPQASRVETFAIANSQAGEVGLACGGRIGVHIARAPEHHAIQEILHMQNHGGGVRVVPLAGGESRLLGRTQLADNHGPLMQLAGRVLEQGPQLFEQEGDAWFLEPVCPPPALVLVGATHIAQVLARLATELGFAPVVVDPRPALANRRRFPHARLVVDRPQRCLAQLIDKRAAVLMLSHDPKLDDPALHVALNSPAFYVGALGSRKTQRARLERLRAAGLPSEALRRLRGPAGLPIGGKGAAEIALSMLAEVVATRRAAPGLPTVAAVVLAAGMSKRAGSKNKLLHPVAGEPMIRRVVRTVLAAGVDPCYVVVGHGAEDIRRALKQLPVSFVDNPKFAEGMGTSIAAGVGALSNQVDAALIVLGDMPKLRAEDLERLCAAHAASTRHLIIAPEAGQGANRRLGNPVLWPRRYFAELAALAGDTGAKRLLQQAVGAALRVPIDHEGVLFDVDRLPDGAQAG